MSNIGIIGQGFVGSAIREGLSPYYPCYTYDLDSSKCKHTHAEVVENSDIIFVCLPTPMRKSGECDIRILQGAIKAIDKEVPDHRNPILIIKSTIPPGTTEILSSLTRLDAVSYTHLTLPTKA